MMTKYYFAALIGVLVNSAAQISLKKGAMDDRKIFGFRTLYLLGYGLFVLVTLINLYALRGIGVSDWTVIVALNFLSIILVSVFVFKERLAVVQWFGIVLIVLGIVIFNR